MLTNIIAGNMSKHIFLSWVTQNMKIKLVLEGCVSTHIVGCRKMERSLRLLFMVLQNFYGSMHGAAVAAVAEMVSIACARTMVGEDKELFLGELSTSYLSAARTDVSFFFFFFPFHSLF